MLIDDLYEKYDEAYDRGDFITAAHYDELIKNYEKADRNKEIDACKKSRDYDELSKLMEHL